MPSGTLFAAAAFRAIGLTGFRGDYGTRRETNGTKPRRMLEPPAPTMLTPLSRPNCRQVCTDEF